MQTNKSKERIKSNEVILKEILFTSLGQTVLKIFSTHHLFLKIFLIIFVLVSSGLASYTVIQSLMTYFSYGVSTTSRIIYENPTLFPKVTFCNVNTFSTEYAYNFTQIKNYDDNKLSDEEKKQLGHDLNDILLVCWFNSKPCNSTDFIWSYDKDYGNCYTFNSGFDSNGNKIGLKQSSIAGPDFGLQVTLYVNVYEKLLNDPSSVAGLGALVRVGNSSFTTYDSNNGIFISSGANTYIVVDREFKSMLPKPYSSCEIESTSSKFRQDSYLYNLIRESDYIYSQQLCFSQCLQQYFIEKYNCHLYIFISLFNSSLCEFDLYLSVLDSGNIFETNYINDVCLPLCPLECNQTLYKTTLSSYQLIGEQYLDEILNNSNLASDFIKRTFDSNQAEKSIVNLFIFYESISYISTTEMPQMDVVSLLSSIGGDLGLFLEMSLFSLCEIVEVAIEMFYVKIKK